MGDPNSGTPFDFTCPHPEVLIGFEGYADESPSDKNLGTITPVCGSLGISPSGDALVMQSMNGSDIGSASSGNLLEAVCAPGEVATGFTPSINDYVSGFVWTCQKVSVIDGALEFGSATTLEFRSMFGTPAPPSDCPEGAVVVEVHGRFGSSIDSMGLGCSELLVAVCGDGVIVGPDEECDDGNLLRRDGCDARCQSEP